MTFIPPILPKFSLEENVMVSVDGKTFPGVIKSLPFSQGGPYIVDCPSAHWPDFFYVSEESITKPNLEPPIKAIEKAVIEREPLQRKTYSSPEVAMDRIRSVTRTALTELDVAYMQNRIKNEPGFALSLLKSAGILDSSGNLAPVYKGDQNERQNI